MIRPDVEHFSNKPLPTSTAIPDVPFVRTPAENCARIKDLGYVASKQVTMYGERLKLISDPVQEGECIVAQVISGNDPTIRKLQLPVSILLGPARSGEKSKFGKRCR